MASRTIPARIISLLCLLAILLAALPCANAAPHHAAMTMATCDTCCPTQFTSTPACCTAAPQPATVVPQPFAAAVTLDYQRLPLIQQSVPVSPTFFLTIRNTSPPPLHPILRI